MKKILFAIGILALFVTTSYAQVSGQVDRWKIVKSLPADQKIVVETKDGKVIKGKFQSGDDEKMSILKSGRPVDISKDQCKKSLYR